MSVDRIEHLLETFRIAPNKVLGQNFLIESSLYPKLCTYAELNSTDVVLDAGAGFGFLALYLASKCKAVVAVEKDPQVAEVLRDKVKRVPNITAVEGDILKVSLPAFNKVIALPPYYLSSKLVMWLLNRPLDCAVLVVQKEFAQHLTAAVGSEEYSWLTVVTCEHASAELLDEVPKNMFYPPPEVDSVILRLTPHQIKPFSVKDEVCFVRLTKSLFTERNKKVAKALSPFIRSNFNFSKQEAEKLAHTLPVHEKRVRELSPKDFGAIANALSN
jgi:16S rRNA (adenine1518-N6/adenine1519-N6)-dimethyltransferase